jgi:hemin uptake protein HemP
MIISLIIICPIDTENRQTSIMNAKQTGKPEQPPSQPRCIRSHELFAGDNRVRIVHEGVEYQLQITRHGKLILTK